MSDQSGRPDLDDVAAARPAGRHPLVVGSGAPPDPPPNDGAYAAVYLQEDQPDNPTVPALWIALDAGGDPLPIDQWMVFS